MAEFPLAVGFSSTRLLRINSQNENEKKILIYLIKQKNATVWILVALLYQTKRSLITKTHNHQLWFGRNKPLIYRVKCENIQALHANQTPRIYYVKYSMKCDLSVYMNAHGVSAYESLYYYCPFLNITFNSTIKQMFCSVITWTVLEHCHYRLLAMLGRLNMDDKSFPVSGLSSTHGSLLCLCQPVAR